MQKKKSKIKVRRARIVKVVPHPAKPDAVLVTAEQVELEIEHPPVIPSEPLVDPVIWDDHEVPEEKSSAWQKFWKEIWG